MALTLEELARRLEIAGDQLPAMLKRVLVAAAMRGEREAKIRVGSGGRNTRTGRLRQSIHGAVVERDGSVALSLRAGGAEGGKGAVRYAAIQEHDGVVRPKKGKYLAIPVGPALTPAGVGRWQSPRDVPGLAFAMSRAGQPMLVMAQKGRRVKAGEVYFVLRRSVTVPGRPYLRPAAEVVETLLPGQVVQGLTELVEAARGR